MFKYAAAALMIALVVKDLLYIGDRYVLRSITQLVCLVLAMSWLFTRANVSALQKQTVFLLYLFVLTVTALGSKSPGFVLAQVASLSSVILFAIALYQVEGFDNGAKVVLGTTWRIYGVILCLCLVAYKLLPGVVFEYEWGSPVPRFRGIFGEPATLAIVSGLTIGMAFLCRGWWPLRYFFVAVAGVCLLLTFSRTFWVACAVAMVVTLCRYYPKWRAPLAFGALAVAFVLLTQIDLVLEKGQSVLRVDSLTNLSGRTMIWDLAFGQFLEQPLVGYGFTHGSDAIIDAAKEAISNKGVAAGGNWGTFTLHNGWVQVMLDSGLFGLLLYTVIVVFSIVRLWLRDTQRRYAAVTYVLIYSAIGNIGETYIFGAAQTHSAMFWMLAVFAFGYSVAPDLLRNPQDTLDVPASLRPINLVRG